MPYIQQVLQQVTTNMFLCHVTGRKFVCYEELNVLFPIFNFFNVFLKVLCGFTAGGKRSRSFSLVLETPKTVEKYVTQGVELSMFSAAIMYIHNATIILSKLWDKLGK